MPSHQVPVDSGRERTGKLEVLVVNDIQTFGQVREFHGRDAVEARIFGPRTVCPPAGGCGRMDHRDGRGLRDGSGDDPAEFREGGQRGHHGAAGGLAHDRDARGVAAEGFGIIVNPPHRRDQV